MLMHEKNMCDPYNVPISPEDISKSNSSAFFKALAPAFKIKQLEDQRSQQMNDGMFHKKALTGKAFHFDLNNCWYHLEICLYKVIVARCCGVNVLTSTMHEPINKAIKAIAVH